MSFNYSKVTLGLDPQEIAQLRNIDTATISATQWGYLGNMDQGVATTNNVQFGSIRGTDLVLTGGTENISMPNGTIDCFGMTLQGSDGSITSAANELVIQGGTGAANSLILRSTSNVAKGRIYLDEVTASTSANTGALVVDGGVGIGGEVYIGGTTLGFSASGGSIDPSATGIIITGSNGASDSLTLRSTSNGTKGSVLIDEVTASTSTITGALRVGGGVGIVGRVWVGDSINLLSGTSIGSNIGGANLTGMNVGTNEVRLYANNTQRIYIASGGVTSFILATEATSSAAASVLFAGGIGVTKKIWSASSIIGTEHIATLPCGGWFYVNATYTTGAGLLTTPAVLAIPYVEGYDSSAYWTPNSGSNGIIAYTNTTTRTFNVIATLSIMTNSGAASTIDVKILKGGVAITGAQVQRYLSSVNDTGSITVQAVVSLANSNTISLQISSTSDTPTYSVLFGSVSIIPIM